ncbi:MAG: hypothetical protein MUF54_06855, partial [Polyangiaceae bacterium]|nr:hypothetical protein [Polyangiaceae bacterium]
MLALLDRYGAKLTIMADVAEILRFRDHLETTGEDRFHYRAITRQLRRAVEAGHDVQLHLHSSYLNAVFDGVAWKQDYASYDLARLPLDRLRQMIGESKRWLEELIVPVKPTYRCNVFRAANWSMQPSENLVRALVEHGFQIDTSVFRYGRHDDLVRFDYAHAYSDLCPWPAAARDICQHDSASRLFEVPIYCELQAIWRFVTPNRIYRVVQQVLNPLPDDPVDARSASPETRRLVDTVIRAGHAAVQRYPWKADFNQCEGRQLIGALRRADARYCHIQPDLPFVLIGHSKTFTRYNAWSLRPFLAFVQANPHRFGFGTFSNLDIEAFRVPLGERPPHLPDQQRTP